MSIFSDIKNWFTNLFNKLVAIGKQFIQDAFDAITLAAIGELKDLALEIVKELATTDMTDDQKRKEAFDKIKKAAKEKGLSIKASIINTLIELAVQYLKNKDEI
jgi:ACT domain-containing protein